MVASLPWPSRTACAISADLAAPQDRLNALKFANKTIQCRAQIAAGSRARCPATSPASRTRCAWCRENRCAQSAACCFGRFGIENNRGQRRGDDVRQVTRPADQRVVRFRRERQQAAAHAFPKLFHLPQRRLVRASRRRDDAHRTFKQIRARRGHAGFLRASHRMTADEMRARPSPPGFPVPSPRCAFTLPTSVTMAPRLSAGSICFTSERICASGVQSTTRSASQTAASKSVVAKSTAPGLFAILHAGRRGAHNPPPAARADGV